jgi:hypothetical protein
LAGLAGALRALGAAVLVGATGLAHARLPERQPARGDERFVPEPGLVRLLSLGFRALAADRYWLEAVQVVGASREHPSTHAARLGRLVEVTTALDPWVDHPYRFAAIWMTDSPGSVRRANRLLARGVAYHPLEWRNRFYLGFNHFYYLAEDGRAADWLEASAALEGSPRYLRRLVARLRAHEGGLEAAALFLREMWAATEDPFARADYEKALDEIETERRARLLDAARAEYRRRHGRDLEAVEDLARGPEAVLRRLPPELHGWEWVIDRASDRIVSSYYGARYEPRFQGGVRPFAAQAPRPREAL